MKIGLIDVDGHNYPNLPLMKISAWHKRRGDTVEWYEPFKALSEGIYDKVYASKVFSFTQDYEYHIHAKEVQKGGSGYCISTQDGKEQYDTEKDTLLPYEIEHIYPDYELYGIDNTAYGFLTRGCPRNCEFCHVPCKEGEKSHKVANLKEFWRGQENIVLCDPNILACKDHIELLKQLEESRAAVEFNQGIDIRLLNERNLEIIKHIKLARIHFAYDRWEDRKIIEDKLTEFKKETGYGRHYVAVYVLVNFNTTIEQDIERIQFLRSLDFQPYPMIYDKQHCKPVYKQLQRWCSPFIFWSCTTFNEYDSRGKRG